MVLLHTNRQVLKYCQLENFMSSYGGFCTTLTATAGSQTMMVAYMGPIWKIMMLY